ncbi:hypothetical protein D3870_04610 [Noviherbaspirillum cavernae]|uniref:Uncharacterized protein n=1 Tax=Noviherbaspirillum cavernae TaxID=2320862 RepID=A0A418WYR6_9BURK|nr:glycosyltransferase [Noviherbaspirillum cavernae]RJG05399.1 hypothetical protein D3870_04610 [Noviherbaspirillum cavernae]
MNLFSILIADNPEGDLSTETLSPVISRNIASFKACHPDLPHRFFDKHAIRHFLAASMGKDVLWAFDQLLPYAYKADLARLCLLYEFGGIYADLSVYFHGPWNVLPGKISIFRDRAYVAPWIVSNTIIAAPPRFPAIEAAIRMILANCHARNRGTSPLCPTGPVLFGKAIAMHCAPEQIHLGEVTNVAARETTESLVFVDTTDGRMIGYRSKTKAGLSELGLRYGVNNYNDFYYAGVIYAHDFPVTVPADYLQKHGHTKCALINGELAYQGENPTDATDKLLVLGNLLPFTAGAYTIFVDLSAIAAGSVLTLFAAQAEDRKELSRATLRIEHSGPATLSMHFDLPASRNDISIGVAVNRCASLSIKQLRIDRTSAMHDDGGGQTQPTQAMVCTNG